MYELNTDVRERKESSLWWRWNRTWI